MPTTNNAPTFAPVAPRTGKLVTDIGSAANDQGDSVTVQADGKIVVAGESNSGGSYDFAVVRYNTNGSLDTGFGAGGKLVTDIGSATDDAGYSVTVQADGKIVVAGYSYSGGINDFAVVRYNTDGSLDTSFNGTGKLVTDIGSATDDAGYSVTVQADGKIVVAGTSNSGGSYDFAVVRYNTDGSLDTGFNGTGKLVTDIGSATDDGGASVSVQSDGKIVVAGGSRSGGFYDFAVVRYNTDGSLDTSFGAGPAVDTLGGSVAYTENASAIALDTDVEVLDADLAALNGGLGNYSGASVTLARSGASSAQDVFSALGSLAFTGGDAVLSGTTVGTVVNTAGVLTITFNANATQALVNATLSSIGYANTSDAPPASVQIDWSFSDGNTGTQGSGAALTGAGSTTVNITAVNDAPTLANAVADQSATQGAAFGLTLAANTFVDLDGDALTYTAQPTGGGTLPSWLSFNAVTGTFSGIPASGDVGTLGIDVTANDGNGGSVTDTFSIAVAMSNNAPTFAPAAPGTGKVVTDIGSTTGDLGRSVTMQADGKIVVAGNSNSGGSDNFAVVRYNTDGSLDTGFGTGGKLVTDIGVGVRDEGSSVTVQADGKIVVAGTSYNNSGGSYDFAVVRYNTNGSLDTTFGTGGKLVTDIGSTTEDFGKSVAVQADGKIVVAGTKFIGGLVGVDFAVVRYNADGSLDTTFGTGGKLVTDIGNTTQDEGASVTVQADGKIVVAGVSSSGGSYYFAVVRYNANGTLDTGFNSTGKLITDIGSGTADVGYSVTVQADQKIVVAGVSDSGGSQNFAVVRYNADGSLDSGFGTGGKLVTDIGFNTGDYGNSVTIQPDGKIVVAGTSYSGGGTNNFAVVRYNTDGSLDTSFGAGPAVDTLGSAVAYTENASAIALDASVAVFDADLAALNGGLGNYSGASVTLARSGASSAQDVFSALGSLAFTGSDAVLSGTTVGTVVNTAGVLTITFNANATQALVNATLSSIGYANTSDAPPASVQIDWSFSDGNTGAQGSGAALTAAGSTTVNITAVNDVPTVANAIVDQNAAQGAAFNLQFASNTFVDLDGDALSYGAQLSGGGALPSWLNFDAATRTFSGTPASGDVGTLSIEVLASDGNGGSVTDTFSLAVARTVAPAAPSTPDLAAGSDTGVSSSDNITRATTPVFSGSAEAGSTVTVLVNGAPVGTTTSDGSGNWTFTPTATLAQGTYAVTATAAVGGLVSGASGALNVTIDTVSPVMSAAAVSSHFLVLTYTEGHALDALSLAPASSFTVFSGAVANAVTAVTVDAAANTATLTLTRSVAFGEAVTVAYTDPTGGNDAYAIQDVAGNDAASFVAVPVANNTVEPPPPPPPSSLVDGVTVTTTITTNVHGQSVTTLSTPPVPADRVDDPTTPHPTLADIVLAPGAEATGRVSIGLPEDVGMRSEAISAAGPGSDLSLRELLLGAAQARLGNGAALAQIVQDGIDPYLAASGADGGQLVVRSITLTSAQGSQGSQAGTMHQPIVITGAIGAGESDLQHPDRAEALVIDMRQLPGNAVLQLDHVEFAIVLGEGTITGGAGRNFVIGDNSAQTLMLGDGDDTGHGGGGNDVLYGGSGSDRLQGGDGNDQLYGGLGVDTAVFTGERSQYSVTQQFGVFTVQALSGNEGVDTLVNIERIEFADQSLDIGSQTESLSWLATLYEQVLGRQADLAGFQWWANEVQNGAGEGQVLLGFILSDERVAQTGQDFNALDTAGKVEYFYNTVLARPSEPAGKAWWVEQIEQNGLSIERAAEGFVNSVELTGQYLAPQEWDFFV